MTFLNAYTVGFDANHMPADAKTDENYRGYVLGEYDGVPKTAEWASAICGTPVEDIKWLAGQIGKDRKAMLLHNYSPGPLPRCRKRPARVHDRCRDGRTRGQVRRVLRRGLQDLCGHGRRGLGGARQRGPAFRGEPRCGMDPVAASVAEHPGQAVQQHGPCLLREVQRPGRQGPRPQVDVHRGAGRSCRPPWAYPRLSRPSARSSS